jgi:Flp pilus assembly protein TadG
MNNNKNFTIKRSIRGATRSGCEGGRSQRGNTIVEFALSVQVLFWLLLVTCDLGFYLYGGIAVENAARVAALRNSGGEESASDQAGACGIVLAEVKGLLSVPAVSTCGASPLTVTAVELCGTNPCTSQPQSADGSPAVLVTVTYKVPTIFNIPFIGPATISRSVEMRLRGNS